MADTVNSFYGLVSIYYDAVTNGFKFLLTCVCIFGLLICCVDTGVIGNEISLSGGVGSYFNMLF